MRRGALLLLLWVPAASAAPPSKQVKDCLAASEVAQVARDELRYSEARRALLVCAGASCPAVVQADCAKWLSQLEGDQPTVVVLVRQGEKDVTTPFRVMVDGAEVPLKPGQPLALDPGTRRISVTLADGRSATEEIVAAVGERNRRLVFNFEAPSSAASPVQPREVTAKPARAAPLAPVLLTAGAVVGAVVFATFGVLGNQAFSPVQQAPCAATRSCDPMAVAPARSLYLVADVGLIAGVLFAGLAVWQWLAWALD